MTMIHYCREDSPMKAIVASAVATRRHDIFDEDDVLLESHTDLAVLDKPDETSIDLDYLQETYGDEFV